MLDKYLMIFMTSSIKEASARFRLSQPIIAHYTMQIIFADQCVITIQRLINTRVQECSSAMRCTIDWVQTSSLALQALTHPSVVLVD